MIVKCDEVVTNYEVTNLIIFIMHSFVNYCLLNI